MTSSRFDLGLTSKTQGFNNQYEERTGKGANYRFSSQTGVRPIDGRTGDVINNLIKILK